MKYQKSWMFDGAKEFNQDITRWVFQMLLICN